MRRVGGLQVPVGLVERVAVAILVERRRPPAVVAAHEVASPRRLVDVVAEMHDEVDVLGRHVAEGGVVALLVLLAGGEGEVECRQPLRRLRCSLGPADRAGDAAHREAIPIGPAGLQPAHLDMHRVRPAGFGDRLAAGHDPSHRLVLGDRPVDRDRCAQPLGGSPAAINRVHSTTEPGVGRPEATPSAKGSTPAAPRPAPPPAATGRRDRRQRNDATWRQSLRPANACFNCGAWVC